MRVNLGVSLPPTFKVRGLERRECGGVPVRRLLVDAFSAARHFFLSAASNSHLASFAFRPRVGATPW